ncbi:WGR domain-containing protein [Magnetococcales bacterium HHB-1]
MKVYLQRLNPLKKSVWFYSLQIQQDLWGQWQLIREWGRAGSPGTLRQTTHNDMDDAVSAMHELKKQLQKKEYRVVMQEGVRSQPMTTHDHSSREFSF